MTEFLSDGISLLETDLLEISDTGNENVEDIAAFKERYRFAFPVEPAPLNYPERGANVAEQVEEVAQAGSHRLLLRFSPYSTTKSVPKFSNSFARKRRNIFRSSAIA